MKRFFMLISIIFYSCENSKIPLAPSSMTNDTYHGQQIEDPYRNLENLQDSTVVNWLEQQGNYAFDILERIPGRQKLIDKQLYYDKEQEFSLILGKITPNNNYFYTKINGNEEIAKLYYRISLEEEEILLYDPTVFSSNDNYHINAIQPDWIGSKIVVSLSKKGEEASEVIVIDVATKKVLPGVIKNCTPSIGGFKWLSDNSGFMYLHVPIIEPTDPDYWLNTKAVLYTIGSNPKKLQDVFSMENNPELDLKPEDFPFVHNYDPNDGYLFAVVGGASSFNDTYYKKESELLSKNTPWKPLYKQSDKVKRYRVYKDDLIFLSAKGASNFQICKTSITNPDFKNPEVLVTEKKDKLITNFEVTNNGIYFTTKKNGVEAKLYRFNNDVEEEIILPNTSGHIHIYSKGPDQEILRIISRGYLNPSTHYIYNLIDKSFKIEKFLQQIEYDDFENLTVDEIEIPSHDGVLVPVSIIRQKDCPRDSNNPTLFFGYGAYGGVSKASFNPNFLTWVKEGGILVFPHIRGGGNKGDAWHKAGYKTTKPNTWKDMIACTEYMIKEGYTSPEKSAIWGSSAGGILAGRAMTERPDLYKAVIMTSPALNMLRCEVQPNGKNSIKEFGTVAIKEEFEALLAMDSYHHIKKGVEYPATFISGGMKDGRVVIWDPAKFVAKLQAYNTSDNPILFGVKFEDGHAAMNTNKLDQYELYANGFAFALWQMGYPEYQPE